MDSIADLNDVAAKLATIYDAGLVAQLKEEVAVALRGFPRSDFDRMPGLKFNVQEFAKLLQDFTGLGLSLCEWAAFCQLCPNSRQAIALETLTEFSDRLQEEQAKEDADAWVASKRRQAAQHGRRAS